MTCLKSVTAGRLETKHFRFTVIWKLHSQISGLLIFQHLQRCSEHTLFNYVILFIKQHIIHMLSNLGYKILSFSSTMSMSLYVTMSSDAKGMFNLGRNDKCNFLPRLDHVSRPPPIFLLPCSWIWWWGKKHTEWTPDPFSYTVGLLHFVVWINMIKQT